MKFALFVTWRVLRTLLILALSPLWIVLLGVGVYGCWLVDGFADWRFRLYRDWARR